MTLVLYGSLAERIQRCNLPEMHCLQTNGAIPHAFEPTFTGPGASSSTLPPPTGVFGTISEVGRPGRASTCCCPPCRSKRLAEERPRGVKEGSGCGHGHVAILSDVPGQ